MNAQAQLRIGVTALTGRMGRSIVKALMAEDSPAKDQVTPILSAAYTRAPSSLIGADAGEVAGTARANVMLSEALDESQFDVLIDFSSVDASLHCLEYCVKHNKPLLIGTTGFDAEQQQKIRQAGQHIPVLLAANTSVGMNLCFHLVKQMAQVLGDDADIEIIETHHRHKVDSPSGTALRLGEAVAETLGRDLADCAVYGRQGIGQPRDHQTIGFSTIRGGDVAGDHTVLFASEGERVELTHKASSRMTFAHGAVRAATWLHSQSAGFYDMQDMLGLKA